jgi:prevent-host-death family protein
MKQVNVHDAKTRLSELLSRVEGGEEITIAKAGRPVARLVPIHGETSERVPGTARGKVVIQKDFDEPLPLDNLTTQRID